MSARTNYSGLSTLDGITGDLDTLDLVSVFQDQGHEVKEKATGKYHVTCPWAHEHSKDKLGDTVVWQSGTGWPTFHCSHNHCEGRGILAVFDHFGADTINSHCSREYRSGEQTRTQRKTASEQAKPERKQYETTGERIQLPTELADTASIE